MADPIEDTVALVQLAIIAALAYFAYKAYQILTNAGGSNCGGGGKPCCSPSDIGTDACVGADGTPCSSWEFWTATTCYKGTPAVTAAQVQAAQQDSSVVSGVGSLFTNPQFTGSFDINAPSPGLPAGYNPQTGTITPPSGGGFTGVTACPEGALC